MKKATIALALLFALVTLWGMPAMAQDEVPGSQSTITMSVPTSACGRASYPVYCYGVPTSVGGTLWIDIYPEGYNHDHKTFGGVYFNGVADLAFQSFASNVQTTLNSDGLISTLTATLTGKTSDDGGSYSASIACTFSYYKSSGQWYQTLTGYTQTVTYN
jgi:hypothetical protein